MHFMCTRCALAVESGSQSVHAFPPVLTLLLPFVGRVAHRDVDLAVAAWKEWKKNIKAFLKTWRIKCVALSYVQFFTAGVKTRNNSSPDD